MGRVFDATNRSDDDWAAKARVSATTITRFYDVQNRRTKKGANLPTGNTLAKFERAAPFTISRAADAPGLDTIRDDKPIDEDIMLRAVEDVLVYILEERPAFDPRDTAAQIMHLYHQYIEREEILAKEPTVTIAGNNLHPRAWQRPRA